MSCLNFCYVECRYAECHYAECQYAECRYAECRYAECRGAVALTANERSVKHNSDEDHHSENFLPKLVNSFEKNNPLSQKSVCTLV